MLRPSYRWQDPPPPAVNYRRNRAYERGQSRIEAQQQAADIAPPAPAAPVFVVDGVEYVEAPEISMSCDGCAAEDDANLCTRLCKASYLILGHDCAHSERIYLRKG